MSKIYVILFLSFICVNICGASTDSRKAFIKKYKSIAIEEMDRTGIPASIKLAQGMLESGCGTSKLAVNANNHFGIKCHNWNGASFTMDDDKRNECFRKYRNPEESWVDHSEFLLTRPRYAFLFDLPKTDYKSWAKGLKKAGYATASDYAQKLIKIIEEEELYQFDRPAKKVRPIPNELNYKLSESKNYQSRVVYINRIPSVKVKEGDTFESIAQYFNIPLKKLLKYNDKNELSIRTGMHVFLAKKKNKAPKGYTFHKTKAGDTMYMISQIYGIKLAKLLQYNYMGNGEKPQVGEMISLRGPAQLY
ncbi:MULTISPECIES: glucosaminidase domain-containing protein [Butyricimonas]|uniref:glucosaminidase domain-containing protein n=1 Tax=Butyricimonas TaxID=574697 RepID=UPI0022E4A822|nr:MULTISPECIES: glucosaminidase domain-containing protein [Butyricimonas]